MGNGCGGGRRSRVSQPCTIHMQRAGNRQPTPVPADLAALWRMKRRSCGCLGTMLHTRKAVMAQAGEAAQEGHSAGIRQPVMIPYAARQASPPLKARRACAEAGKGAHPSSPGAGRGRFSRWRERETCPSRWAAGGPEDRTIPPPVRLDIRAVLYGVRTIRSDTASSAVDFISTCRCQAQRSGALGFATVRDRHQRSCSVDRRYHANRSTTENPLSASRSLSTRRWQRSGSRSKQSRQVGPAAASSASASRAARPAPVSRTSSQ